MKVGGFDSRGPVSEYGYWGEHPDYPVKDWKYLIENDDIRSGYWDWVEAKIEEVEIAKAENG